jgi:hypothetical protein
MHPTARNEAELARFRARWTATETLAHDEVEALRRPRPAPRIRPEPKPRPARLNRLPPRPSRKYAKAMSASVIIDPRLTDGASRLAGLIRAEAGKAGEFNTTKLYLALAIERSTRTIRRRLIELETLGYIKVHHVTDDRGVSLGLRIVVTDLLRPYYEKAKPGGVTAPPSIKSFFKQTHSRVRRQGETRSGLSPPKGG